MFRHRGQLHDGGAVEKRNFRQAVERGHRRSAAGTNKDVFRGQRTLGPVFQAHGNGFGSGESRFPKDQVKILGFFDAGLISVPEIVDYVSLAAAYALHVYGDASGVNAVIVAAASQIGHATAGDHRFRRRTTHVDASSADVFTFDDRGLPARLGQRLTPGSSPLAGTDDNGFVVMGRRNSNSPEWLGYFDGRWMRKAKGGRNRKWRPPQVTARPPQKMVMKFLAVVGGRTLETRQEEQTAADSHGILGNRDDEVGDAERLHQARPDFVACECTDNASHGPQDTAEREGLPAGGGHGCSAKTSQQDTRDQAGSFGPSGRRWQLIGH